MQNRKLDLVIPLGNASSWHNNELRYVLRSFEKNFANLRDVYIVGPKLWITKRSPWLTNVILIDYDDPFVRNKDGNMIRKVIKVIDDFPKLSDPFIRATDDQFLLKPVDEFPPMYTWDFSKKDKGFWNKGGRWRTRAKRTYRTLSLNGRTTFNYDGHFPVEVHKDFKKVMESYPYTKSIGFIINTLYFNNVLQEHFSQEGCVYFMESPCTDEKEIREKMKERLYFCFSGLRNNACLNDTLKSVLQKKFKKPSRFECSG